ncbi:dTDP-4-dehydrorhamnose reductase [Methanobrevibacter sp.]|uniref:dTDP-4-dehydrorhamnose reductase n=1 Tax=Methanobrevibacter sp. TaxID=66852 RepID=UPI003867C9A1
MKILITGSNGMLGHDLIDILQKNHELIPTTSKSLDITDENQVMEFICDKKPDIVINSAAYTDVDGCEENQELAYCVNGEGVRNLALACRKTDSCLVHISTDYVFDGTATEPISEDGEIGPISVYGKSKLIAEEAIQEILDRYFIVRTAWLYGVNGKNFPKTMLELAESHSEISVVYDEVGTPTYTPDLAFGISQLIESDQYGIYHLTNSGSCSWCEFARYIFEIADCDVKVIPVTASEFARPAPRPSYSVLDNKNWIEKGFKPLRSYKDAIKEYIELIK